VDDISLANVVPLPSTNVSMSRRCGFNAPVFWCWFNAKTYVGVWRWFNAKSFLALVQCQRILALVQCQRFFGVGSMPKNNTLNFGAEPMPKHTLWRWRSFLALVGAFWRWFNANFGVGWSFLALASGT